MIADRSNEPVSERTRIAPSEQPATRDPAGNGELLRASRAYGLCENVTGNWRSWATTWFGEPTGARSIGCCSW